MSFRRALFLLPFVGACFNYDQNCQPKPWTGEFPVTGHEMTGEATFTADEVTIVYTDSDGVVWTAVYEREQ